MEDTAVGVVAVVFVASSVSVGMRRPLHSVDFGGSLTVVVEAFAVDEIAVDILAAAALTAADPAGVSYWQVDAAEQLADCSEADNLRDFEEVQ